MTQLLSIVWPPLDDTSNRQLSDAFLLWSGQRDPVGSENNIYSFQADNEFRMVTLKRLLNWFNRDDKNLCKKAFYLKTKERHRFMLFVIISRTAETKGKPAKDWRDDLLILPKSPRNNYIQLKLFRYCIL